MNEHGEKVFYTNKQDWKGKERRVPGETSKCEDFIAKFPTLNYKTESEAHESFSAQHQHQHWVAGNINFAFRQRRNSLEELSLLFGFNVDVEVAEKLKTKSHFGTGVWWFHADLCMRRDCMTSDERWLDEINTSESIKGSFWLRGASCRRLELTSGNPNSSVSADVCDNHFFGSERIWSFHAETRRKGGKS